MRTLLAGVVLFVATTVAQGKEINLTPDMVRDVTAAIQAANFNCPLVKLAYAKGEDAFGTVAQVYCGPKDGDGVYEKAVFRITFRPNGGAIIKPWP